MLSGAWKPYSYSSLPCCFCLPCAGPGAPEHSSAELVEPAGFLRVIAVRVLLLLRSRRVEIQCWLLQVNKPLLIPTSPMCLEIAFLDGY